MFELVPKKSTSPSINHHKEQNKTSVESVKLGKTLDFRFDYKS